MSYADLIWVENYRLFKLFSRTSLQCRINFNYFGKLKFVKHSYAFLTKYRS